MFAKKRPNSSIPQVVQHAVATPLTILLCQLEHSEKSAAPDYASLKQTVLLLRDTLLEPPAAAFPVAGAINETVLCLRSFFEIHATNLIPHDCSLVAPKIALQIILNHLISNAHEAYETQPRPVFILSSVIGSYIQIKVSDFGKGMTYFEKHCCQLKGFTTKKSGSGTGVWHTQKLLSEKFNGKLCYQSDGTGTTACLTIPIDNQTL